MPAIRSADQGWSSPNGVMAIAIAAALVVLAACVVVIRYADNTVDATMAAREARLMGNAVDHELIDAAASVADAPQDIVERLQALEREQYESREELEAELAA